MTHDNEGQKTTAGMNVNRRRLLAGVAAGAASVVGLTGLASADCTCYCVEQHCNPDTGCECLEYKCEGDTCPE